MNVKTKEDAWAKANKIFPTEYKKDESFSERAGYDIYRHPTLNYYCRICDLGDRLEVLTGEHGENITNIWIMSEVEAGQGETGESAPAFNYGLVLAEKIRTTVDFANFTDLEKFILNNGWKFKTKEDFQAGYDRAWKCAHEILLTEDEFVIEAGECYETDTLKAVYAALVELVKQKKLTAGEIYSYAYFKWCLRNPEAVIAYQRERDKWEVNNCGTQISEEEARVRINREWGFEVSRIEIIGFPYYDATDYQFIRFDCAHMTWLWKNGNLYQVYE